ncbi:sigma factor-like helix-turn-helix DNA-binding protein [Mycoplasma sp. ATU-Cv-508]|uniref:sigma factor-like helix-turn-helix DNA-binding protein n=1 Tax=Mycoplasma sp. ATU-Cv-508 TaxID=2048001 RepID=UPI000FDE7313
MNGKSDCLLRSLRALFNQAQKQTFHLYYLEDLTLQEVADVLATTRQAVSDTLKKARQKLSSVAAKLRG